MAEPARSSMCRKLPSLIIFWSVYRPEGAVALSASKLGATGPEGFIKSDDDDDDDDDFGALFSTPSTSPQGELSHSQESINVLSRFSANLCSSN